jgi:hypothetical protein
MLKAIYAQEDRKAAEEKARVRRREARRAEAPEGGRSCLRGCHGDALLLRLPARALATAEDEQPPRASPPRDPAAHACDRELPRWGVSGDARRNEAPARGHWGTRRYMDMPPIAGGRARKPGISRLTGLSARPLPAAGRGARHEDLPLLSNVRKKPCTTHRLHRFARSATVSSHLTGYLCNIEPYKRPLLVLRGPWPRYVPTVTELACARSCESRRRASGRRPASATEAATNTNRGQASAPTILERPAIYLCSRLSRMGVQIATSTFRLIFALRLQHPEFALWPDIPPPVLSCPCIVVDY